MKRTIKDTCHITRKDKYGKILEEYDESYETEIVSTQSDRYYRTSEEIYAPRRKALWSDEGHCYQCVDEENGIWERTR